MKKKGLSLLEILTSVIILSLVTLGLTSLFITAKRHILHARFRMTGGELGKLFLDPLQMQVRQDQWGNNCLSSNPTVGCPGPETVDNIPYTPGYNISDVPGTTLRKVKLDITWNEITPD